MVRGAHEPGGPERERRNPPSEKVKVPGILNDFPRVPVPGGVQVQLGDAYADERCRVVLDLHIPGLASLGVPKSGRGCAPLRLGR